MHLIKRYSNRKLYDTVAKTYITLDTVASMVREGERIEIIENDTGETITAAILAQIIAEDARKTNSYSPSVFVQMIRKSGDFMWDSARKIAQTVGEKAYSLEEQIEHHIKKFTSDANLPQQEQFISSNAYKKIEEHVEIWIGNLLQKLNIPNKNDLKKLHQAIDALEQRLKQISITPSLPNQPTEISTPSQNLITEQTTLQPTEQTTTQANEKADNQPQQN